MKLSHCVKMVMFLALISGLPAQAKSSAEQFDTGMKSYMASNCAAAMEPFYQSTLREAEVKDRAHLYLAHCQSIFGRNADAAYNLDQIKSKHLKKEDQKLYKDLTAKHQSDIDTLHKLYFNVTTYAGQGSNSPSTVKSNSSFWGLSLGVSRPVWSVGAFYESYSQKMTPATYDAFSQTMTGAQLGYFILPTWRVSGSYTGIHGSNDQLNSVTTMGIQTDYYFTPAISLFLEYYSSNYPTLIYSTTALKYKLPASANEMVAGVGFPIYNAATFGFNGSASYSSISLTKSNDAAALAVDNLGKDTSRTEAVISAWAGSANAAVTYWSGKEVLGVRSRGAVIMNTTDLHKGGSKIGAGYTFTKNVGIGASYAMETYSANDVDGKARDFQNATTTGMLMLNW